ncbi:AAA family ATPase [Candidatus Poribacteria bacterium]
MKLHWVELENWRQHNKTRIDFDEETTVIYGPNEAGKSTVLEALSKGFFDRSNSQAEHIRRITPLTASGNVASVVTIEFTLDQTRYRVEKSFNLRKGTSLYKIDDGKSVLMDQDTADEQLIKLLEAELPSTRGSKPSQWGAFQWLWANQSNRDLPDDREGDPTVSLHLEKEDRILVTPKFQAVQDTVQASYLKYFTRTGRVTSSSPIPDIENEIEQLQQKATILESKIEQVEGEKQKLEALQRELPGLEERRAATKEELSQATGEAIDLSAIESDLKASEGDVEKAEREVQDAEKALTELDGSAERIERTRKEEREAGEELSRLQAVCELLDSRLQEKNEEVEEMAMEIRKCEELTRDARNLRDKADTVQKVEELEKKIGRLTEINGKIEALREKEAPIAPTDKEIDELNQSRTQIEMLRERLTATGLTVHITHGEESSLDVEIDGEKLESEETSATGTESVSVEAPGLGSVTVKAELTSARDAKVEILRLEENIRRTLSKYDLDSIEELKELNLTQKEISSSINELVAERRGVDERPVEEMNLELRKLREQYEEYEKMERSPVAAELNPTDGNLDKLVNGREAGEDEARRVLDKARTERDEINEDVKERKEELAGKREAQKHLAEELNRAIDQQNESFRKYGSAENQERGLAEAKVKLEERKEEHSKIKQKYDELEKGPVNRIKRLDTQIKNQEQIVTQQRAAIDQLRGAIGADSLEGTYSELARVESEIEVLTERLERETIRSKSFKLLKETLDAQYRSALSAVIGPIQDEVKRALSYVTGFLHEDVELNEYLFPNRLGERGIEAISLEFNDGSSGLKEALAVCVRLAVARHLSEKESQCLILDDPFVHVSSDRSNKMIELINEAIDECGLQVIVLTHRQMEFAGFAGKMVDIQSVK